MLEQLRPYIHPGDLEADYVQAPNQYEAYFEYAREKKPRAILEIGVRRGYSIIAMCLGHLPEKVCLIDSVIDGIALADAEMELLRMGINVAIYEMPSRDAYWALTTSPVQVLHDLIHIDGEHTVDALRSDLQYLRFLAPDGWIIVDDVKDMPELMDTCKEFAAENNLDCVYNETFRGHAILRKKHD